MASEKKKNSTIYTPDNLKGEVSVFILYPGIPVTCSLGNKLNLPAQKNIGEIYMPPSVKAGVPDWFDKYVLVFPHTHTQPYVSVKNEVNEVLSTKGLKLKSLNVGIFSGSGNLSIPATEKLNTFLVMDTVVGGNTEANTSRVLKEGGKVFCMFGPSNWGGAPKGYGTDYWKKVWGKLNTEDWGEINQKTYKTFGFPPDGSSGCGQQIWHMVMPQYFLKYFKSKIEAAQAPTTNNQVAQNTQQTQQTQQTQNTQTNNNQTTNNQPSNQQPAPQTPEPSPNMDWTMGTQSQPFDEGTYNFNVERKNFFVIPNIGELRLVTEEELKKLGRTDLALVDEEYLETSYQGEDEALGINAEGILDMRLAKDKELEEQYKKEQSGGGTPPVDTGTGTSGNTPPLKGGGSMKGGVKVSYTKKTPSWGKVTKGLSDAQLLKAMVDYIEGGYFYPGHAYTRFKEKDRATYANSGETLWGIDRCAGQTETTELGKKFWAAFDKISGHGNSTGNQAPLVPNKQTKKGELVTYAQATKTKQWDIKNYPPKPGAIDYGKSPLPSTPGYDIMYNSFVELAVGNLKKFSDTYFKGHPLRDLIFSDARMKFCWFRSTWNGPGFFKSYAANLRSVYDSGTKDIESLIIADLNFRASKNIPLITHDVVKISQLLGIEPSQNA